MKQNVFLFALVFMFILLISCKSNVDNVDLSLYTNNIFEDTDAPIIIYDENNTPLGSLSVESLTKMPIMEYESLDPWMNETRIFTGVDFHKLLKAAGLTDNHNSVYIQATDGYEVIVSVDDLIQYDYALVYKENGKYYSE